MHNAYFATKTTEKALFLYFYKQPPSHRKDDVI